MATPGRPARRRANGRVSPVPKAIPARKVKPVPSAYPFNPVVPRGPHAASRARGRPAPPTVCGWPNPATARVAATTESKGRKTHAATEAGPAEDGAVSGGGSGADALLLEDAQARAAGGGLLGDPRNPFVFGRNPDGDDGLGLASLVGEDGNVVKKANAGGGGGKGDTESVVGSVVGAASVVSSYETLCAA